MKIVNLISALPRHPYLQYSTRDVGAIENIAVHHTAGYHDDPYRTARHHIEGDDRNQPWPGIGYHFYIQFDGTINQTNDIATHSYHVAEHNRRSIGIVVAGNLKENPIRHEQYKSLLRLIRKLRRKYGKLNVKGHREFEGARTSCPGLDMNVVRQDVENQQKTNDAILIGGIGLIVIGTGLLIFSK